MSEPTDRSWVEPATSEADPVIGRPKDLEAVAELEALQEERRDQK